MEEEVKPTPEFEKAIEDYWLNEDPPGGFVVGWLLILEAIDDQGKKRLNWVHSDGLKSWEFKGYIHEAMDAQVTGDIEQILADQGEE